jgi:hypothetical protein
MNGDGSVVLAWGGEDRRFRLAIGQLRELQELINRPRVAIGGQPIGPKTFFHLLESGDAWPHEVREVLRLGLIGAGVAIDQVPGLLRRYFDERPFQESALCAPAIFAAGWAGPFEDPVGKKKTPEGDQPTTSRSSSPDFTAPAAPSDSIQERSIN